MFSKQHNWAQPPLLNTILFSRDFPPSLPVTNSKEFLTVFLILQEKNILGLEDRAGYRLDQERECLDLTPSVWWKEEEQHKPKGRVCFPTVFGWSSSSLSLVSNYLHEQQIFLHFVIPIHHILYGCKLFLVKKKCACIECTLAVYFQFKKYI